MKHAFAGIGSIGGALLAHIPCCGSSALLAFGGAGAGLSWLTVLHPYRWLFVGLSTLLLAIGFWQAYRKPHACHTCGDCASEAHARRRVKIGTMWVMAAVSLSLVVAGSVNESAAHSSSHSVARHQD